MEIINKYEQDGYIFIEYSNGTTTIEKKPSDVKQEPESLSEIETAILDTAVNTEYLVCLADLGI